MSCCNNNKLFHYRFSCWILNVIVFLYSVSLLKFQYHWFTLYEHWKYVNYIVWLINVEIDKFCAEQTSNMAANLIFGNLASTIITWCTNLLHYIVLYCIHLLQTIAGDALHSKIYLFFNLCSLWTLLHRIYQQLKRESNDAIEWSNEWKLQQQQHQHNEHGAE